MRRSTASTATPSLDFHRFVLIFNHSFSDRLRFVGELELEHAFVEGLEDAGELELEQAYIDVLIKPSFNLRAGMLLVPVGIINERHEPPVFHGVERPFVDTVIIPTTWFDVGAGVHGRIGSSLAYRAYVMAPLDATEFTADEGLRGGIQKGSEANVRNVAMTGRVEFTRVPRTDRWPERLARRHGFQSAAARPVGWRVRARRPIPSSRLRSARAVRARLHRRRRPPERCAHALDRRLAERRASAAGLLLRSEPAVPRSRDRSTRSPSSPGSRTSTRSSRCRPTIEPIPAFQRRAWTAGATYYLDPDVALKFDYTHQQSEATIRRAPRSINVGLGWWF